MKAFGDGAWSNFHFSNPPGGGARRGTLSVDVQASSAYGERQPQPLSSSFYLSSFAMRWTVPVPTPSDLATFKIPTPFASCCRTFRSVAFAERDVMEFWRPSASFRFDIGRPDHLAP